MWQPLISLLVLAGGAVAPSVGQPPADFRAAFDDVHRTVAENFFDPELRGLDWEALGLEYGPRAAAATTLDEFGEVINEMLARLETSHTRFFTARQPAYYQLLAIFRAAYDEQIREAHADNVELRYPGIGIFTKRIGDEVFIHGVLDGGPAQEADLRVGDRIIAVEGRPFHPIGSFEGRVGKDTVVEVQRRQAPADRRSIVVRPILMEPDDMFLQAMERSIRLIDGPSGQVGYVHLWSFAGPRYQEVLNTEIMFGRLRDADALIIDLRDGWGGANPNNLNLFNDRVPVMAHITRDGERREIDSQWRKPVALLINGGARSGKEVYAYGFRKHGLGPVVGSRTAGAVVGGRPYLLRPGMLLYLAVLDVRIDGERLEGHGVAPDIDVPFVLPYANGADPQLERALEEAGRILRHPS
ncbi:MAG: S41 family peptidase [Planctomycetota bacterium]|jgi:carboxyl-terminal processing protease